MKNSQLFDRSTLPISHWLDSPWHALVCLSFLFLVISQSFAQDQNLQLQELKRVKRIYVPIEQLGAVVDQGDFSAVLTKEQFEQLLAEEIGAQTVRHSKPQQAIVHSADYEMNLDGDRLVGELKIHISTFDQNWNECEFNITGWNIESASLENQPVAMTREGKLNNLLRVFINEPGQHQLSLQVSAPLLAQGGDKAANVQLPQVAAGEFRLTLPAGKFLESSQIKIERPAAADLPATYLIPVGGSQSLSLLITDRSRANKGEFLTFASTAIGLHVQPSETTWIARTELQVFGHEINQLRCLVPVTLEITDVQSTGLESWELGDAEGGQTAINLQYRQGFEGRRTIKFKGILADSAEDAWSVPALILPNVTSHTGAILIQHPANLRLQAIESNGVRPVSKVNLPDLPQSGDLSSLQYQIWDENFELRFASNLKEQEVHAAMTNILDLTGTDVFLYSTISVETRLVPLFEFQVLVPNDWRVSYLIVNDSPVDWRFVDLEDGRHELRIPLDPPLSPGQTKNVSLTCRHDNKNWPPEEQALQVAIPEVSLPQVEMLEALYGIAAEDDLKVTPQQVGGLDPGGSQEIELLNQKLTPLGKTTRLAYTYQDIKFSGALAVTRKPTNLFAETLTFFRIDEETIYTRLEAKLDITGGGLRELELKTSASAGTALRFQITSDENQQQASQPGRAIARLIEQVPGEVEAGMQTWKIRFDRYLTGHVRLFTDVRIPRAVEGPYSPVKLEIPVATVSNGFLAVESAPDEHVTIQTQDVAEEPLSIVDPVEFPAAFYQPQERVVAGYRFTHPDWTVNVTREKFERGAIPTVIGHHAELTSVLSQAGQFQHQAIIDFTAVGAQALIANLPDEASLWSTLLNGNPIEVRRSPTGIQIPIVGLDDGRHQVQLTYSTTTSPLDQMGEVTALPPSLSVVDGNGNRQAVEILAHDWNVHFPAETLLISSNGLFEPTSQLFQSTFFDDLLTTLHIPDQSNLIRRSTVIGLAVLFLAVCWLLAKVIRSRRFTGRVSKMACLGCGAVVLLLLAVVLIVPLGLSARHGRMLPTSYYTLDDGYYDQSVESASEPTVSFALSDMEASGVEFDDMALDGGQQGGIGGGGFGEIEEAERLQGQQQRLKADEESRRSSRMRRNAEPTVPPMDAIADNDFSAPDLPSLANTTTLSTMPALASAQPNSAPQAETAPSMPTDEAEAGESHFDQNGDSIVNVSRTDRFGRNPTTGNRLSTGGLLSMTFNLQIPEGTQSKQFRYQGNGVDASQINLHIRYANQTTGQVLIWSFTLGITLMGWWLRNAKLGSKSLWMLMTLLFPFALAWCVPDLWQLLLQGVLFGGLGSLALWSIHSCWYCCRCCCGWLVQKKGCSPTMAIFVGSLLATGGATLQAESKPALPTADAVIIPYESFDEIDSADRVWVPQRLYRQLWLKEHPQDFPQAHTPIKASIAEATYHAALQQTGDKHQILIQARWVITSLTNKTVKVTLPVKNTAISTVKINGQLATLDAQRDGTFHLLLQGQGVHIVDGVLQVAAHVNGRLGEFELEFLPVNSGQFHYDLPETDGILNLRVDGLTRVFRQTEVDGKSQIQFPIDRGGRKTISWFPETERGGQNQIVQVETAIAALIQDAGAELNHVFQVRVRQGAINDLSFLVPTGLSVREITGEDLGGWEMNESEQGKILKVFFRREINDQSTFAINLFQPLNIQVTATQFDVPTIEPLSVTRETAQLAVFAAKHLRLRALSTSGVNQIAISRFQPVVSPSIPDEPPLLAYRTSSRPLQVSLEIQRRTADARIEVEHGVQIGPRKRLVATRVVWQLTEAPKRRVDVSIPEGYLPMSVVCAESSDWYVHENDEGRTLTIEFPTPKLGRIEAGLEGHFVKEPDDSEIVITLPHPQAASRISSTIGIWIDSVYQATLADVGGWNSLRPDQLSANYEKLDQRPVQFALQSQQSQTENVTLNIQEATPRLNSDLVSVIAASDVTIDYGMTIRWNISQAAAGRFVFQAPAWLGHLEIQGAAIREIHSEPVNDEQNRWTVTLIDPVRDQYLLSIAATTPIPQDHLVRAPLLFTEVENDDGEYRRIQVQQHYALLVNLSQDQLAAVDSESINSVALQEVPLVVHEELAQQAMEVIRIDGETNPTWRIEKMQQLAVAKAIILAAHLETVLELDGSWRTRVKYAIRNRGRQFLAIKIPVDSRILSVFLRNKPARTVIHKIKNETYQLIALPQTSVTDLSFDVDILLAGRLERSLKSDFAYRGRRFSIPAPEVLSQQESEDFGLPVTQTLWTVHLPEGVNVAAIDGIGSTNLTPHDTDSWLAAEEQALARIKSDIAEMVRLSKDKSLSKSHRSYAKDNLKQLNLSLSEFGARYYGNTVNSSKASELRDELYGENQFLQEQTEKALQEAEVELQADAAVRFDAGRDFILNSNSVIISNNGGSGIRLDDNSKQLPAYNFLDVSDFEQSKSEAKAATAGKKISRSKLKSQIADQKLQFSNTFEFGLQQSEQLGGHPSNVQREAGQQMTGGRGINITQNGAVNGNMFIQPFEAGGIAISGVAPSQSFTTADEFTLGLSLNHDFQGRVSGGEVGNLVTRGISLPEVSQSWTKSGGLSIEMALPQQSQTLSFSKVGGSPELTLNVQPEANSHRLWGIAWAVALISFGMWVIRRLRKSDSFLMATNFSAELFLCIGIIGFYLLPNPESWPLFWLFVCAGIVRIITSNLKTQHSVETEPA